MTERSVSIHVPAMTRVEGEGSLRLRIEQGKIEELALGRSRVGGGAAHQQGASD